MKHCGIQVDVEAVWLSGQAQHCADPTQRLEMQPQLLCPTAGIQDMQSCSLLSSVYAVALQPTQQAIIKCFESRIAYQ
jgi:hypothetical protein